MSMEGGMESRHPSAVFWRPHVFQVALVGSHTFLSDIERNRKC